MPSRAPQSGLPHVETRVGYRYRNTREQESAVIRYLVIRTETPTPMREVCAAINDIATNGS